MLQRQLHCKVLQWFSRQLLLLCAELELWLLVPSPVIERLAKILASAPLQTTVKPGARRCGHKCPGGSCLVAVVLHPPPTSPAPCWSSLFESCRIKVAMGSLSVCSSAELHAFFCV